MMDQAKVQSIVADIFKVAGLRPDGLTAHDEARHNLHQSASEISDSPLLKGFEAGRARTDASMKNLGVPNLTDNLGGIQPPKPGQFNVKAEIVEAIEAACSFSERLTKLADLGKHGQRGLKMGVESFKSVHCQSIAEEISNVKPGAISAEQVFEVVAEHCGLDHS